MGAGRRSNYNPRTGKWTRPKAWYDHSRGRSKKSGCYVATAVYGSYDCPQVWVLRRYRDEKLSESFLGRVFIKTYYAISPTLVKWFGNTSWFTNLFKSQLDRKVATLMNLGFSDSPYKDKD
jgi:hypothetical protein